MVVIFGLLIALALFYFWLLGQWFARWVVAIVLFVPTFMVAVEVNGGGQDQQTPTVWFLALAFSLGVAWLIASLPTFYQRRRSRPVLRTDYRIEQPVGGLGQAALSQNTLRLIKQ